MALRVLHVLCDLSGGGAERLVLELARRAAADVRVEVAAVQDGGVLADDFAAAGVVVHRLGRRRGRPGGVALLRLCRLARGFDVVHTHLWAGDAWGRPAAALAGVPVRVSTEHNVDRDEPPWKHHAKVATSRLVHRVVAVSAAVADYWRDRGVDPERLVVIDNGVDRARFAAPWRGGGGLLAIGRLVRQKGFDVLIDAMAALPPTTRLDIVGDGPLRDTLTARAGPNVRLLGRVDDLPERLATADVVVVPSRWEGFGLVAAEAMAAGAPVVASDVDGLRDVVGDAGVLVPPADPRALAAAIAALLADPARRLAASAQGRRRSERFDIEVMVRRYEALYRSLDARREPGPTAP